MKILVFAWIVNVASSFTLKPPASTVFSRTTTTTALSATGLDGVNGGAVGEGKKVLVLGGDGFCGWPTSLYLSDQGHDVVVVDNLSRRNIDNELGCDSLTPIQTPEVSQSIVPSPVLLLSFARHFWMLNLWLSLYRSVEVGRGLCQVACCDCGYQLCHRCLGVSANLIA